MKIRALLYRLTANRVMCHWKMLQNMVSRFGTPLNLSVNFTARGGPLIVSCDDEPIGTRVPRGAGVLPHKGLAGTCGPTGYGFQDFCLERGIFT